MARGPASGLLPTMPQQLETAKANGLKPYYYLRYLFEQLPVAETEDDYRNLLPQNISPEQITLPAE